MHKDPYVPLSTTTLLLLLHPARPGSPDPGNSSSTKYTDIAGQHWDKDWGGWSQNWDLPDTVVPMWTATMPNSSETSPALKNSIIGEAPCLQRHGAWQGAQQRDLLTPTEPEAMCASQLETAGVRPAGAGGSYILTILQSHRLGLTTHLK